MLGVSTTDELTDAQLLRNHELYQLDASPATSHHIIYAPLADSAFVASDSDIRALARAARLLFGDKSPDNDASAEDFSEDNEPSIDYLETFRELTNVAPIAEREGYIRSETDFLNLSILPNNVCNFACSYCYSARGRSSARIDIDSVKTAIDYFFALPRTTTPPLLTVSIFGGGEPMLSWDDVVAPAIAHIYDRQLPPGQRVMTTLITNGSILSPEMIATCQRHKIDLAVSFDILEDVQNAQRRHYNEVRANLRTLISHGITPAINAVVTELNVQRQQEMIETLHANFPEIKYVSFEPVIGEVSDEPTFYRHLARNFIQALHKATALGITLSCTTLRNIDVSVDRYCAGEFALCADGSISVCPCVSSAKEPNFHRYVYGSIEGGKVNIDSEKLRTLLSVNVHSNPWCRHCFAKWNCGGGCMNTNILNANQQNTNYCAFTQAMTKHFLYTRLEKTYREEYNEDLTQYINPNEYLIR